MTDVKEPLDRRAILGLVAMGLAVLVIANDFTALSVALPCDRGRFRRRPHHGAMGDQRLRARLRRPDRNGRPAGRHVRAPQGVLYRRGNLSLFSLIGGLAPNVWVLLVSRGLMGVGGALMWPAILGMTYALLPASRAGLAGGLILGAAGFGNAVGPLLGGILTDTWSWRWIFFLNLPIAAFAVWVTLRVVAKDSPAAPGQRIDYAGVIALSIGLFALLLALDEGATRGWYDPLIIGLFIASTVALAAFGFIERGSRRRCS